MLTPGERAALNPTNLATEVITPICVAFYGVRPGDILPETMIAVILWLQDKDITIADIQIAYKEAIIEKKPYLLLSRDEILKPIREYWHKKAALLAEVKLLDVEQRKEEEEEARKSTEKRTAIELFYQCYKQKEWTGNEFQAKAVRNLEQFSAIDTRVGRLFWKHAKREQVQRLSPEGNKPLKALVNAYIPSDEFVFSQKWATYICKNQILITLFQHD